MASVILEQHPTASADLANFWTLIAFGSMTAVWRKYGAKPRLQDRLAAAAELCDRLHGRAVQAVEIDDRPPVPAFALPADTPGVSAH